MSSKTLTMERVVGDYTTSTDDTQRAFREAQQKLASGRKQIIQRLQEFYRASPFHVDVLKDMHIVDVGDGFVRARFFVRATHLNYHTTLHGGVFDAIADVTMAMAVLSLVDSTRCVVVRTEQHLRNLAPAFVGDELEVRAEVLSRTFLDHENVSGKKKSKPVPTHVLIVRTSDRAELAEGNGAYPVFPLRDAKRLLKHMPKNGGCPSSAHIRTASKSTRGLTHSMCKKLSACENTPPPTCVAFEDTGGRTIAGEEREGVEYLTGRANRIAALSAGVMFYVGIWFYLGVAGPAILRIQPPMPTETPGVGIFYLLSLLTPIAVWVGLRRYLRQRYGVTQHANARIDRINEELQKTIDEGGKPRKRRFVDGTEGVAIKTLFSWSYSWEFKRSDRTVGTLTQDIFGIVVEITGKGESISIALVPFLSLSARRKKTRKLALQLMGMAV
jgi:uncharacterized protein (TIGR00369 family)